MIYVVFYSNLDTAALLAVRCLAALHLITTLLHTAGSQPRLGLAKLAKAGHESTGGRHSLVTYCHQQPSCFEPHVYLAIGEATHCTADRLLRSSSKVDLTPAYSQCQFTIIMSISTHHIAVTIIVWYGA